MTESIAPTTGTHPLGVSRPDLAVDDLPAPEEVFGVRRIGAAELFMYAVGPSLIALGISIGSGEWLLGPQAVGQFGFVGVGWVILISAVLQTVLQRRVLPLRDGDRRGAGRRLGPGAARLPAVGAAVGASSSSSRSSPAAGPRRRARACTRWCTARSPPRRRGGAAALGDRAARRSSSCITAAARRISRSLELANWVMVGAILVGLILIDLFVVPFELWWEGIRGFVTPAAPPEGITATQLGALAGFTALASGLNWYVMGHYRDKGYGMGYRTGLHRRAARRAGQAARRRRHVPRRRDERRAAGGGGTGCCWSTCGASSSSARCSACCCRPS